MTYDTEGNYTAFGVPRNRAAAAAMTHDDVRSAVLSTLADLEAVSVAEILDRDLDEDGSPAISSHAAVNVLDELILDLDIDLNIAKIEADRWSSVEGLTQVIVKVFEDLT